jgi:hypothetical protein
MKITMILLQIDWKSQCSEKWETHPSPCPHPIPPPPSLSGSPLMITSPWKPSPPVSMILSSPKLKLASPRHPWRSCASEREKVWLCWRYLDREVRSNLVKGTGAPHRLWNLNQKDRAGVLRINWAKERGGPGLVEVINGGMATLDGRQVAPSQCGRGSD